MKTLGFYFTLGWEHIISAGALDHQLFIVALVSPYLLKDWKQLLILVTAFTIGHSLTLILSTLNIVRFNSKWVEFLIPCTIAFTAALNLFKKKETTRSIKINYILALLFGLIHGMGFANSIRFMLSETQHFAVSILGFNFGLEAGQIVVVIFFLMIAWLMVEQLKIIRREWIVFLSAIVLALSSQMIIERISEL